MASDYRSDMRAVMITFRATGQERKALRERAAAEGFETVQQLLEHCVFGEAKPRRKPGPQPQAQELPMTG